jgi:phosphoribosylaminoimidazole-succinocarboxamide synthase
VVKHTFEKSTEEICISTLRRGFRKSSRAQSPLGEISEKSQTATLEKKLEQASRSSIWSIMKRHTMTHLKAIPELDGSSDFELID